MQQRPKAPSPVTSIRIDPDLIHRAKILALNNRRAKRPADTFSKIVGMALADYLKSHT